MKQVSRKTVILSALLLLLAAALLLAGCSGDAVTTSLGGPPTTTTTTTEAGAATTTTSTSLSGPPTTTTTEPSSSTTTTMAIDPAGFSATFTNEYFASTVGMMYLYERKLENGLARVTLAPTSETRVVVGVECAVFTGYMYMDDPENPWYIDTVAWFAEDADGNVWCFGEDFTQHEGEAAADGGGSWEAGVDGAVPVVVMKGAPQPGDVYHHGYADGGVEVMAEVLEVDAGVEVPYGSYEKVVKVKEWTAAEPGMTRVKYYAPGVGLVLVEEGESGSVIEQLIDLYSP